MEEEDQPQGAPERLAGSKRAVPESDLGSDTEGDFTWPPAAKRPREEGDDEEEDNYEEEQEEEGADSAAAAPGFKAAAVAAAAAAVAEALQDASARAARSDDDDDVDDDDDNEDDEEEEEEPDATIQWPEDAHVDWPALEAGAYTEGMEEADKDAASALFRGRGVPDASDYDTDEGLQFGPGGHSAYEGLQGGGAQDTDVEGLGAYLWSDGESPRDEERRPRSKPARGTGRAAPAPAATATTSSRNSSGGNSGRQSGETSRASPSRSADVQEGDIADMRAALAELAAVASKRNAKRGPGRPRMATRARSLALCLLGQDTHEGVIDEHAERVQGAEALVAAVAAAGQEAEASGVRRSSRRQAAAAAAVAAAIAEGSVTPGMELAECRRIDTVAEVLVESGLLPPEAQLPASHALKAATLAKVLMHYMEVKGKRNSREDGPETASESGQLSRGPSSSSGGTNERASHRQHSTHGGSSRGGSGGGAVTDDPEDFLYLPASAIGSAAAGSSSSSSSSSSASDNNSSSSNSGSINRGRPPAAPPAAPEAAASTAAAGGSRPIYHATRPVLAAAAAAYAAGLVPHASNRPSFTVSEAPGNGSMSSSVAMDLRHLPRPIAPNIDFHTPWLHFSLRNEYGRLMGDTFAALLTALALQHPTLCDPDTDLSPPAPGYPPLSLQRLALRTLRVELSATVEQMRLQSVRREYVSLLQCYIDAAESKQAETWLRLVQIHSRLEVLRAWCASQGAPASAAAAPAPEAAAQDGSKEGNSSSSSSSSSDGGGASSAASSTGSLSFFVPPLPRELAPAHLFPLGVPQRMPLVPFEVPSSVAAPQPSAPPAPPAPGAPGSMPTAPGAPVPRPPLMPPSFEPFSAVHISIDAQGHPVGQTLAEALVVAVRYRAVLLELRRSTVSLLTNLARYVDILRTKQHDTTWLPAAQAAAAADAANGVVTAIPDTTTTTSSSSSSSSLGRVLIRGGSGNVDEDGDNVTPELIEAAAQAPAPAPPPPATTPLSLMHFGMRPLVGANTQHPHVVPLPPQPGRVGAAGVVASEAAGAPSQRPGAPPPPPSAYAAYQRQVLQYNAGGSHNAAASRPVPQAGEVLPRQPQPLQRQ